MDEDLDPMEVLITELMELQRPACRHEIGPRGQSGDDVKDVDGDDAGGVDQHVGATADRPKPPGSNQIADGLMATAARSSQLVQTRKIPLGNDDSRRLAQRAESLDPCKD